MQSSNTLEMFAAPRGNIQVATNYFGVKFYTSDKLKENFLKAMNKSGRAQPIVPVLEKLIKKNEFIPCYLTDKISKFLLRKRPEEFKYYAGITIGKYIFVFVDNDTNIFGFSSNEELSITTVHELIHKASNKFPKEFYQLFKNDLIEFYTNYWSMLFNVPKKDLSSKEVDSIISFVFFNIEKGEASNKNLTKYYHMLYDTLKDKTSLSEPQFRKLVTDYIVLIKIVFKAMSSGSGSLIQKACMTMRHIIKPCYITYSNIFGIKPTKIKELCYQELYAPSEVISLPALIKRPSGNVYRAIKKL